jgi:NAD(P)-dependent dehydrogenase (short-subunit alcohol dehydrogenase family)
MALALLKAGHRVFLTSTDRESLEQTRLECGAQEHAEIGIADLADKGALDGLVEAAIRAFGRIDILLSNAAAPNPRARRPVEITSDQFRRLFEINTIAPIGLMRRVVPDMVARGWGRIIFVSTSLDTMLNPDYAAYGMTKAAGEAFITALAASLQSTGVTANVLLPGGMTATRMVAHVGDPKRLLQPGIMAAPVTWLASDESNGVTGRRFIAAKWNAALTPAQAAQAASAPSAWKGFGDQSVKPV